MSPLHSEHERLEEFKRYTQDKLRGLRCPEHRQAPRLHFHGSRIRDITISLSGCCPELMKLANQAVAACGRYSGHASGASGK